MNHKQAEEIESLNAIFCKEGELTEMKDSDGCHVAVKFEFDIFRDKTNQSEAGIQFLLSMDYPDSELPVIFITCSYLASDVLHSMLQKLMERAAQLQGQPSLLDLCLLGQDLLQQATETFMVSTTSNTSISTPVSPLNMEEEHSQHSESFTMMRTSPMEDSDNPEPVIPKFSSLSRATTIVNNPVCRVPAGADQKQSDVRDGESNQKFQLVTTLLRLDHMRSKLNYVKQIKKWVVELGLIGRLIFCQKLILILLQGEAQNTREYIVRNRTTNVDVDSKGRSCKERMLTVLCEVPAKESNRLDKFSVVELQSVVELAELFASISLDSIYEDFVRPLVINKV